MVKNIILKISSSDDMSSPCIIEASMNAEDIQATYPSIFTLSSLKDSLVKFERWKKSLRQYLPVRRDRFRGKAIAYSRQPQPRLSIKTGNSELLLDVRPWSWTGVPTIIEGEEIKQLSLPSEAEIEIDGKVQKLSFTKFALLTLEQEYKKYTSSQSQFDGVSEVRNFGGWLKDINKKKFLKQLVILQKQGLTYHEAKQKAYLKTPFGKARYEIGITEFKVTPPEETFAPLMQVMKKDEWTEKDYQDLREEGVPDDLWTRLNVPQHIIVSVAKRPQSGVLSLSL